MTKVKKDPEGKNKKQATPHHLLSEETLQRRISNTRFLSKI